MIALVGILNVTPDSFSDGGQFLDPQAAIDQAAKLFADGASLVDVGAESTRPGAAPLSADEEWERLQPVLAVLLKEFPDKISLDTYHPKTVLRAFAIGPVIVNDVTGLQDPAMVTAVLKTRPPKIIVGHLGRRTVAETHVAEPLQSVEEVRSALLARAQALEAADVRREQIILDPGIGFGKTMELNRQLLAFGDAVAGYEVMIGYSRKRFLGDERMELAPNLTAAHIAVAHGARYLRVHDVAGHAAFIRSMEI